MLFCSSSRRAACLLLLSAKYPLILQLVVEDASNPTAASARVLDERGIATGLPISNLYLDCNGIVHPCCHPEGKPQPKTEAEMFENVAALIDRLVAAARPSNLLYLALDGVAPRAKVQPHRSCCLRVSFPFACRALTGGRAAL